jgi:hypothetical protein
MAAKKIPCIFGCGASVNVYISTNPNGVKFWHVSCRQCYGGQVWEKLTADPIKDLKTMIEKHEGAQ